jgi:hypothetical protein
VEMARSVRIEPVRLTNLAYRGEVGQTPPNAISRGERMCA